MALTNQERQAAYKERQKQVLHDNDDAMKTIGTILQSGGATDHEKLSMIKEIVKNCGRATAFNSAFNDRPVCKKEEAVTVKEYTTLVASIEEASRSYELSHMQARQKINSLLYEFLSSHGKRLD